VADEHTGRPLARFEDGALLTGCGRFADDLPVTSATLSINFSLGVNRVTSLERSRNYSNPHAQMQSPTDKCRRPLALGGCNDRQQYFWPVWV